MRGRTKFWLLNRVELEAIQENKTLPCVATNNFGTRWQSLFFLGCFPFFVARLKKDLGTQRKPFDFRWCLLFERKQKFVYFFRRKSREVSHFKVWTQNDRLMSQSRRFFEWILPKSFSHKKSPKSTTFVWSTRIHSKNL